jgi:hypothetical protein
MACFLTGFLRIQALDVQLQVLESYGLEVSQYTRLIPEQCNSIMRNI